MATTNKDQHKLINYPVSLIVLNCKFSYRPDDLSAPDDTRICLKNGLCTCLSIGKTIEADLLDPTQRRDDVDRFIDGDRYDSQPDNGF